MSHARSMRRRGLVAVVALASSAILGVGIPAHADSGADNDSESAELMARFGEMDAARTAPTGLVAPGAYSAASAQLGSLPAAAGSWTEVTRTPYNSDDPRYRDPSASNSSGGAGYVTGRIQALAVDGVCVFAGAAGGGVSRSCNSGASWTPISDALPTQSIGYLAVAPDGALWLATGDGTTGSSTYVGTGVYRLANPDSSTFTPATRIGGTELESQVIRKLVFDVPSNKVFVAASRGVYSHSLTGTAGTVWSNILAPCRSGQTSCTDVNPSYWDIANDVAVQPGSNGQVILANVAWRSGAAYNGFYLSTNAGASWSKINPTGAINPKDVGNATFAYAADGSQLYVVLESPAQLNAGAASALAGVYVSRSGAVAGPYDQIANASKLAQSGSAERKQRIGGGYMPGVQAWYNQFAGVDPANPNHVYLGLEEVYESFDGGLNWSTVGPVLELRLLLLELPGLAEHLRRKRDPLRPARHRLRYRVLGRPGVRRQRRRGVPPLDGAGHHLLDLAVAVRPARRAAVLLGRGRQGRPAGCRAGLGADLGRPAGQRRLAAGPGQFRPGVAVRR